MQSNKVRVALVTGGTSGIGAEVARQLAHDGFTVVINGRDHSRGAAGTAQLETPGHSLPADLTATGACEKLVEDVVATAGQLDVLGQQRCHRPHLPPDPGVADRHTVRIRNQCVRRDLLSAKRCPSDTQPGPAIVNITSRSASVGVAPMAVYAASKGALLSLTRAAAVELAPDQIRVNAVAPGMTRTPLYQSWPADQRDPALTAQAVTGTIPLARLAEPADVAAAVAFMVSDDARCITGESVAVDGRYTAH